MSDLMIISDIAKVRRGASPRPIDDPQYFGGDVGWVRIIDVTRSKKYLRKTEQYLSPLGVSKSVRVDSGDLVMSICGTIGRPIIIDMAACIHDGFVQLYDIHNADVNYLYYALQFAENDFIMMGQPGTQVNLNTTIVENKEIFCPSIPIQQKIADILSTVDEQIEQTEAVIAKYQSIKKGMMQDLFSRGVDRNGKLRPTYEQAPEIYKNSELGMIPKEWEIKQLSDVAEVNRGKFTARPRNDPKYYGGEYPFIQTGDIANSIGRVLTSYSQTLNDLGTMVSRSFPAGTILVTIAANIADTAILGIPMYLPDSVVGVEVHRGYSIRFIELWLRQCKTTLDASAPQSAQKNINLEDLRPLKILVPEYDEQKRISSVYEELDDVIIREDTCLAKYRSIKQGLMQDLLTGKVPVVV